MSRRGASDVVIIIHECSSYAQATGGGLSPILAAVAPIRRLAKIRRCDHERFVLGAGSVRESSSNADILDTPRKSDVIARMLIYSILARAV